MRLETIKKSLTGMMVIIMIGACGDNFLESLEDTDNIADATIALDEGDPAKAIELCLDELGGTYKAIITKHSNGTEPDTAVTKANLEAELDRLTTQGSIDNPRNAASVLSSAYAQKAGVDMVDVALNLATNAGSTPTNNPVTSLGAAINDSPTQAVLDDMELALIVLRGIGQANYREAESYKDSIFQMAHLALFTNSITDISALTLDDALSILVFLEESIISSSGTNESADSEAQASLDAINEVYAGIGVLPGDTDAQKQAKVQTYFDSFGP